jgi:hypothetical protein
MAKPGARREFDAERGEDAPLLSKIDTADREVLTQMHEIARTNTNFPMAVQLAIRSTVLMCLMAMWVWIPSLANLIPDLPSMALVACLFVFTINPKLGIAIQLGISGFLGTLWAILHVWFMNFWFPGGLGPDDSVTSWCSVFGWANFLIFLWLLLWCKCGIGMKMFALSYDIGFCLAFLNKNNPTVYSGSGAALSTLIATLVACLAAPLMNLLPYPMSLSYASMKTNARNASRDTARLFEAAIAYYAGSSGPSIVVETELKHSMDLRALLDGMGGDIGASWFEGFDSGSRGTVRALMQAHLDLMEKTYDRLRAVLVAMQTEDFGTSHTQLMSKVRPSCYKVGVAAAELLCYITDAACDGTFNAGERTEIERLILQVKTSVSELAREFDMSRRAMNVPINTNILGECFFVMSISAYARLVWEFGEMMMRSPPQATGFGTAIVDAVKSTWDPKVLSDPVNMNFATKHFIAIVLCWIYSVYVDDFSGACVITSVFLINGALCPDIQAFLNVMNAVILAFLSGSMIFKASCWSGHGEWVLPLITTILWAVGLYCLFSKSILSTAALFIVALTPFKLVQTCPPDASSIHSAAAAEMHVIKANVLAILFVASVQYLLAYDRPSMIATDSIDSAFKDMRKAFKYFWDCMDTAGQMGSVNGAIDAGAGYNASAKIEPRLFRYAWKGEFYEEVLTQLRQVRLDILMAAAALGGSDGTPDAIFQKISTVPEFKAVRDDLNQTLEDAHTLVVGLLSCEGSTYDGLKFVKDLETIDKLDAIPGLISNIAKKSGFPLELAASVEDDELVQLSSVFHMLNCAVKDIAGLIKLTVQYS